MMLARSARCVWLVVLIVFVPTLAVADDSGGPKVESDQRDFTRGISTVAPKHVQIESSITATRSGDSHEYMLGDTQIRVGLSKRSELRLNVPSYLIQREGTRSTGFDDSGIEARIVLSKTKKLSTAVTLFSTLPTGSRSVAERRFQPGAVLAASFSFSPRTELVLNAGGESATSDGQRFSRAILSASLRHDASKHVNLFSEVYFLSRDEPGGPSQKFIAAGAVYTASQRTAFYGRIGSGLGNHVGGPDYFYGFGIAQLF